MGDVFFTSDHHFGHRAVIKYGERPFSSVEEMDEALIEAWNSVVQEGDTVYHLGDFSFHKPGQTLAIYYRLRGLKHLVKGNHDRPQGETRDCWHWIKDYYELTVDGCKFVLCHYPFETWNKAHYGSLHLHGHSHGNLRTSRPGRMDVGVDSVPDYRPISLDEVVEALKNQQYIPVDHHGNRTRSRG